MPRLARGDTGGEIYHVINRANGRFQIFNTPDDYKLFEKLLLDTKELVDMVEIKLKNKTGRSLSL